MNKKYITKYENFCVKEWMLMMMMKKRSKKKGGVFFFSVFHTNKKEKSMPATAELWLCYYVGSPFSWYFSFFHFYFIQKQTLIIK